LKINSLIFSVEKIIFHGLKYVYKPRNTNVFSKCGSKQHGSTTDHSDCEVLLCPIYWMGLMMICCGIAVRRMGMLGVSVREMKTLTVKIETETETLLGKSRYNLTCIVY
jgi:hypothetical protein